MEMSAYGEIEFRKDSAGATFEAMSVSLSGCRARFDVAQTVFHQKTIVALLPV
ncbi:hypothetical protein GHK03_06780 [Sinorhizobium medicae]|uniref:hypothetical protein n=1 Tax=Sinorhizobium medicae TaxID=110321 RepID=UPI0012961F8A|nr:hypothetical protein [Sinorhizobium medicae]MQX95909.1 hypothetical protein [Sinorhizobium medicae]